MFVNRIISLKIEFMQSSNRPRRASELPHRSFHVGLEFSVGERDFANFQIDSRGRRISSSSSRSYVKDNTLPPLLHAYPKSAQPFNEKDLIASPGKLRNFFLDIKNGVIDSNTTSIPEKYKEIMGSPNTNSTRARDRSLSIEDTKRNVERSPIAMNESYPRVEKKYVSKERENENSYEVSTNQKSSTLNMRKSKSEYNETLSSFQDKKRPDPEKSARKLIPLGGIGNRVDPDEYQEEARGLSPQLYRKNEESGKYSKDQRRRGNQSGDSSGFENGEDLIRSQDNRNNNKEAVKPWLAKNQKTQQEEPFIEIRLPKSKKESGEKNNDAPMSEADDNQSDDNSKDQDQRKSKSGIPCPNCNRYFADNERMERHTKVCKNLPKKVIEKFREK
jgi:hypothetical protein